MSAYHLPLFQPQFQLGVPIMIANLAMLVVITEPHHVMTTHSAEVALGLDLGVPLVIASLVTLVVIL